MHTAERISLVLAAVFIALPAMAQSQTLDTQKLIEALKEKGATRSAGTQQVDDRELEKRRKIIGALQNREKLRGLSVPEKASDAAVEELTISADVEDAATDRPKMDVEIYFAYNSDVISPEARPLLATLGKSLRSNELKGRTFILVGHTDAKGEREYNKELSERRALAVKNYLVSEFSIPENELAVIGEGPDKLKLKDEPYAPVNRRVEVVNMGQVALNPNPN